MADIEARQLYVSTLPYARRAYGLTQKDLAARLGDAPNTVAARWERGELELPQIALLAITSLFEKLHSAEREREDAESGAIPAIPIDAARLRQLMQLCHPDKHNNPKAANDATAWLVEQRRASRKV